MKNFMDSLVDFANKMSGAVGSISNSKFCFQFLSSGILGLLVEKVPMRLQMERSSIMYDMQPKLPTIADSSVFLKRKICCEFPRSSIAKDASSFLVFLVASPLGIEWFV